MGNKDFQFLSSLLPDMAQILFQVSGLQHDTEHEELQGLRQVALLRGPRAQGQGHNCRRYTRDEKAG